MPASDNPSRRKRAAVCEVVVFMAVLSWSVASVNGARPELNRRRETGSTLTDPLPCVSLCVTIEDDQELPTQGAGGLLAGSKSGIQAIHAPRLRVQLGRLDASSDPQDMNLPGWKLHQLKGDMKGTGLYRSAAIGDCCLRLKVRTQSSLIIGTTTERNANVQNA